MLYRAFIMPKRSSTPKPRRDENQAAYDVLQKVIAQTEENAPVKPEKQAKKNPAAVALGRLGGKKGGKARAEKMTPEQRSEIARKAAAKRWEKKTPHSE